MRRAKMTVGEEKTSPESRDTAFPAHLQCPESSTESQGIPDGDAQR